MIFAMATFWSKVPQFQDISEDNIIVLDPYLNAADAATEIFDFLGFAFAPCKNDMKGNIKKIRQRQETNKEKFTSLNAILQDEKENHSSTEGQAGALWLTRALLHIQQILVHLIDSVRKEPDEQAFRPILMKAYEETLKQYHGMILRTLIATVSWSSPSRPVLMKIMALDKDGMEEQVLTDIESYLVNLIKTNEAVTKILKDFGQFDEEKV